MNTSIPAGWRALATAADDAAGALRPLGGGIAEVRDQQPAMRRALSTGVGWRVDLSESTLPLTGWCHPPRGIDVAATDPAGGRWIGELKLRKTDEILWDLLKVADGLRVDGISGGFLLVGAVAAVKRRRGMCLELLEQGTIEHDVLALFRTNQRAWLDLLQGGSARPVEIPRIIRTQVLADPPIELDASAARLLLIAVDPDWSRTIEMNPDWWCGDWPPGVEPDPGYITWRRQHCRFLEALEAVGPLPVADAQALSRTHRLNLTRDSALTHVCEPLVTAKPSRMVSAAGRAFVERWGAIFGA